ncbi:MAG: hypothetical protein KF744_00625 [Taibaiella sp.]|nr:hypothetical protein [Taibaiella sp.]
MKLDYNRIKAINKVVSSLPESVEAELNRHFAEEISLKIDPINKCIKDSFVRDLISTKTEFDFIKIDSCEGVPFDVYLTLISHWKLKREKGNYLVYNELLNTVSGWWIYSKHPELNNELSFHALAYYVLGFPILFSDFTVGFDGKDWDEIFLLQSLLPLVLPSFKELKGWLKIVSQEQINDGAISSVAESVYKYVLELDSVSEIETQIQEITNDKDILPFLTAILKGVQTHLSKPPEYYWDLLQQQLTPLNDWAILAAVGNIYLEVNQNEEFFSILNSQLNSGKIGFDVYLQLCNWNNYYNETVFEEIAKREPAPSASNHLRTLMGYLYNCNVNYDTAWIVPVIKATFQLDQDGLNNQLDTLLTKIAQTKGEFALEILEERLRELGGKGVLENTVISICHSSPEIFQKRFISWLNSNDVKLHSAAGRVTLIHSLGHRVFYIPSYIFNKLSLSDRLYVAYKCAGYVHGKEPLEEIFVSLIKAVEQMNSAFVFAIERLMNEYVVYNYRGILGRIRKETENSELSLFAKEIFDGILQYFNSYFHDIKEIKVEKELFPQTELKKLKRFYQGKQFEDAKKNTRKGFFQSFFKNVMLNSNSWAIRRPGQTKHQVTELGTISETMEFPSGQILDPFQQEYFRRVYQTIRKDEINID